jgi:hypothetical protein
MDNPRLVGHIVAVQGFRVKVELLPETRSALRATPDGVQAAIAINAYLTFSLGAGETVIGIITDLEARETFDPNSGDDLSLELMKPRRIASVQLLGTVEHAEEEPSFSPGICRVEMWRGGRRSGVSVAAPFVWRCPNTRAVAPFPHPAHRTGHADCPHPALGQDLTPSPTAGRSPTQSDARV